ncbi:protein kinase [Streptomyces sp. NPDC002265]|uniref:protein kinase domain-containing protein n=1 Tax=Streptomyces sp. NPDC002265 TaxID=3154415 RepID=UPI00332F63AE
MGRVWRAVDEILDRLVAVKEMRIDGLDAEDTRTRRERTLREARATARIDHPHVVRVYDVVDEGERLWIVMELVAGRSLERAIAEDGPLSPGETARIGLGLVAALRQVHAGGVLHRDIKPGNVLVESGGRRVVLTDFGIAAIQDAKALTMVGMLVGSPDYMAPERISGRHQGPPSDVWSLGATLCAALGGRSPFSRGTTLATLHAVLYEEPELPASAGPLRALLAALLEKEPTVRPSLEDVESALRPIAFPEPTPTLAVGGAPGLSGASAAAQPDTSTDATSPTEPQRPNEPAPPTAPEPERQAPGETGPAAGEGGDGPRSGYGTGPSTVHEDQTWTAAGPEAGNAAAPGSGEASVIPTVAGSAPEAAGEPASAVPARAPSTPGTPPVPSPEPEAPSAAPQGLTPAVGDLDPAAREPAPEAQDAAVADADPAPGPRDSALAARDPASDPQDAIPAAGEDADLGSEGPVLGSQDSVLGAQDLALAARGLSPDPQDPALVPEGPAPTARDLPPVAQDPAPTARDLPPVAQDSVPSGQDPASGGRDTGPGVESPTRVLPRLPGASSTPVSVDGARVPDIRDPRQPAPAPVRETAAETVFEARSEAWSEARSEARSEVRSETSSSNAGSSGNARSTGDPGRTEDAGVTGPAGAAGRTPESGPRAAMPSSPARARRRTAVLAAAGAVAATGAVVAVVLAMSSSPPAGTRAGGSSPQASASATAPTGGTPSPTVEGTFRPPSLPPGAHQEAGGFAWVTPKGWRRDVKTGAEVHYTSPDGTQELVAKSSLARGDLMDTWRTSEQNAHQGQGYRKIRLDETTFRGNPAVVWEYTFTLKGVQWYARLLGFDAGGKSYQINTWYQPQIESRAVRTYNQVKDGFTLL